MALLSTIVKVFHDFPLQNLVKLGQDIEDYVAEEDDEVEILRAKRAIVILLEDIIPQVQFVAIFTISIELS